MKKNILFLLFSIFLFQGCFSLSSLNPFSDSPESGDKVEIEIPSEAPTWLKDKEVKNSIAAIGISKNIKKDKIKRYEQNALINAGNNLSRKIYVKAVEVFNDYVEKTNTPTFENDIKKHAKEVATACLNHAKVKGFWEDEDKTLYTQIHVSLDDIASVIQIESKKLFEVNYILYENILSNRAKEEIIKKIEE